MALPLSVSMMNKIMRRKWSAFKLSSKENVQMVKNNFLTAFPSSQMNRAKLASAMSWRRNV